MLKPVTAAPSRVKQPWLLPLLVSATALAIPYGRVAPGKTLPPLLAPMRGLTYGRGSYYSISWASDMGRRVSQQGERRETMSKDLKENPQNQERNGQRRDHLSFMRQMVSERLSYVVLALILFSPATVPVHRR
jgi:hypothetical protein